MEQLIIPNNVLKGKANLQKIPEIFTLGTGHVSFFYNKLTYLKIRYVKIYDELKKRGCNITNKNDTFQDMPTHIIQNNKKYQINLDYIPTNHDRSLLIQRIESKNFYLIKKIT